MAPAEQPAPARPPSPPAAPAGAETMSRSKRRREKRKLRKQQLKLQQQSQSSAPNGPGHKQGKKPKHPRQPLPKPAAEEEIPIILSGPKMTIDGLLELAPKGYGFLRMTHKNFEQARDDIFVPPEVVRRHNLRHCQWIHGCYQTSNRGPQLVEVEKINGANPEEAGRFPHFEELKAVNPTRRLAFETTPDRFTTRVIDIMTPVGRGQRGLIVSPPRSGKTTMLLHTAEAVSRKYNPETSESPLHLMILLVDERPEEVTEFRRALPDAEIYASSNDEGARNHCRIAELAIERAKRLVEAGQDVFLLMDSITRLARAYNSTMSSKGRGTGSGGITIGALEVPRRLFAAARNTRGGGSLTILATALIQTNSRADEAIFQEFKGTGNMELVLDRKIAENYIYPAVDIFKSGTRREELLLPEHMLHKVHLIRRGLAGHRPVEAMERLVFFLRKFPNNPQMLLEIKG
jgi:transcription termination factor Rho